VVKKKKEGWDFFEINFVDFLKVFFFQFFFQDDFFCKK